VNEFRANGASFWDKDDMIIRWLRANPGKTFEPATFIFMKSALAQGDGGVFVDVGASTGWFSIPFALMDVPVIAFEPNPRVLDRLRANRDLNQLTEEQLRIVPAAASDRIGSTTFWSNPALPLTSGGSIEAATCGRPTSEEVPTVTLDSVVADRVALLKIDVEGHEASVLAGASRIIEEDRPTLVLEANTPEHFARLEHWLIARDYISRRADERNILATPC
jgi:FkbM family methyltransferase